MRAIHVGQLDHVTIERLGLDASASVWPMCATCGASVFIDHTFDMPRPFKHEVRRRHQWHSDGILEVVVHEKKKQWMKVLYRCVQFDL